MHTEKTSDCREQTAIVLPSLDPDSKFQKVVEGLLEAGFRHIVIVDDGSKAERKHFFDEAAQKPGCVVLTHEVNKGKGRALKTAFAYVRENLPGLSGVITIDGDGQHLTGDIIACGNRMLENPDSVVLGCRDFSRPGIPPRSVAGNKTTSRFFRILGCVQPVGHILGFVQRLGQRAGAHALVPGRGVQLQQHRGGQHEEHHNDQKLYQQRIAATS